MKLRLWCLMVLILPKKQTTWNLNNPRAGLLSHTVVCSQLCKTTMHINLEKVHICEQCT